MAVEDDFKPADSNEEEPQIFGVSFEAGKHRFSRRKFVEAAATTVAATTLSGCSVAPIANIFATETPLPTATPVPTDTPTPTLTPTPTATKTSTPTPTFTPTPVSITVTVINQGARVRTGPDTIYPIIGSLAYGVTLIVIGKLADNSWLKVQVNAEDLPNLTDKSLSVVEGWIRADQIGLNGQSTAELPVDEAPPTPTPLPNETIEPGAEGIQYTYTDLYGNEQSFTLPCGSEIPDGAVCVCNCVASCSCDAYTAPPCSCDSEGGTTCTCDSVHYWYPN